MLQNVSSSLGPSQSMCLACPHSTRTEQEHVSILQSSGHSLVFIRKGRLQQACISKSIDASCLVRWMSLELKDSLVGILYSVSPWISFCLT